MKMPSDTAMKLVDQFSWQSNVVRDGKLISQEYVVAEAIDKALAAEREACARVVEQAAKALICGRRRTNQVDRHTAAVLMSKAEQIRRRVNGEGATK